MFQQQPPGWGDDQLSAFINHCINNTFASYVKYKDNIYATDLHINNTYIKFVSALKNDNDVSVYSKLMLLRSHCAFTGAVRMVLSTQTVESYMLARGCIESALYGLYIQHAKSHEEIWLHRHDDKETRKEMRKAFSYNNIMKILEGKDRTLHDAVAGLYQITIDHGGHPNERAITSCLETESCDNIFALTLNYLNNDEKNIMHSAKIVANVGLCALSIFCFVFPKESTMVGIMPELVEIEKMIARIRWPAEIKPV